MGGEPFLAPFQRLHVVGGGQPGRAPEREEVAHPQLAQPVVLTVGHELPGGDLHVVGLVGIEGADRAPHHQVDDEQVGEDQVVAAPQHAVGPLLPVQRHQPGPPGLMAGPGLLVGEGPPQRPQHLTPAGVDRAGDGVAVAQVERAPPGHPGGGRALLAAGEVPPRRLDHLDVALVGGHGVVGVEAVLHQQLPVGPHRVQVGAAEHRHALLALVGHQVDHGAGVAQVGGQVGAGGAPVAEHEPPVRLDPGRPGQAHVLAVEVRTVSLVVGHRHQVAGGVEAPPVVEALEEPAVALGAGLHRHAPVGAGVDEDADLAGGVAGHDHGTAAHPPGAEVVVGGHLALVADVEPARVEDGGPLPLQHAAVDHGRSVDPEPGRLPVVDDEPVGHGVPFPRPPVASIIVAPPVSRRPALSVGGQRWSVGGQRGELHHGVPVAGGAEQGRLASGRRVDRLGQGRAAHPVGQVEVEVVAGRGAALRVEGLRIDARHHGPGHRAEPPIRLVEDHVEGGTPGPGVRVGRHHRRQLRPGSQHHRDLETGHRPDRPGQPGTDRGGGGPGLRRHVDHGVAALEVRHHAGTTGRLQARPQFGHGQPAATDVHPSHQGHPAGHGLLLVRCKLPVL